ncbi:hypothetical protein JCM33374_g1569 [Metschnikowia sp. JCM 33374]|nr:hypothetical protein JCM33374_g1569 [Metschnikowia sp. JCM 33374]
MKSRLGTFTVILLSLVVSSLGVPTTKNITENPASLLVHQPRFKASHEEITTQEVEKVHECEIPVHRDRIEKVQGILDKFMGKLMSFIHDTTFDVDGFDSQVGNLRRILGRLDELAKKKTPCINRLRPQFKFARRSFEVMLDSAEMMKFFKLENGLAQSLIHKTIVINVRVLALYNRHGAPDLHNENYASILSFLAQKLRSWSQIFENLRETPISLKLAFYLQRKNAEESLISLIKEIPE